MIQYLTPNDIANNIRMTRTLHSGPIIIAEGTTDIRVYERFFLKNVCIFIPSYGKNNAISALYILEKDKLKRILVIVDSDFWKLESAIPNNPNLMVTDTHDLETMIISSETFNNILNEFGSLIKIKKIGTSIRNILLKNSLPLGYLRWISSPTKLNLSLKFKGIDYNKFIDKKAFSVDLIKLIEEILNNSNNTSINKQLLIDEVKKLEDKGFDPWHVCSGHDLIEICTIGFKKIFGNKRSKSLSSEALDAILRLSYEHSHFIKSELYVSIKNWAKNNLTNEKILK